MYGTFCFVIKTKIEQTDLIVMFDSKNIIKLQYFPFFVPSVSRKGRHIQYTCIYILLKCNHVCQSENLL